jgi:integrase
LAPATTRAYQQQVQRFLSFLDVSPRKLRSKPAEWIDLRLADYIQHLYSNGHSFTHASHAVFGLIFHYPRLKSQLGESRLRLKGWERLRVKTSHPPITWELTVLLAVTMARSVYHAHSIAILLAFDCYLRVGELCRLRRNDIALPHDPRLGSAGTSRVTLHLQHTKTGPSQSVEVQDTGVGQLLCSWLQHPSVGTTGDSPVFPFTSSGFRSLMRRTRDAVGLSHIPYTPHSLRHGGATADFLQGGTIEQVLYRGRWAVAKSARIYLQTSRGHLIQQQVPPTLHQWGARLDEVLVDVMTELWSSVPPQGASGGHRQVRFARH